MQINIQYLIHLFLCIKLFSDLLKLFQSINFITIQFKLTGK